MDMKQFQTKYSKDSITYWPSYEVGRIGIIFFLLLGILFIATSIWTLLDNTSRETRLELQVALPIVVVALCAMLRFVYRTMHTRIVVSNTGIEYFKNDNVAEKQISWGDVAAVYFIQEPWYGRKTCRIFLNNGASQNSCEMDKCDFVLPVNSVDERKLLQLIPDYLWKNNPWENWSVSDKFD